MVIRAAEEPPFVLGGEMLNRLADKITLSICERRFIYCSQGASDIGTPGVRPGPVQRPGD
jgi:hypothetical protein